jgi:hypothetical protein
LDQEQQQHGSQHDERVPTAKHQRRGHADHGHRGDEPMLLDRTGDDLQQPGEPGNSTEQQILSR